MANRSGSSTAKLAGTEIPSKIRTLAASFSAPVISTHGLLVENHRVDIKFIACDNETAQTGLISGAFDVILCVAQSMKPGVTYETLVEVPAYLLVPRNHSFAARSSVSLKDLDGETLVLLDLPAVSEYYSRILEEAGVSPRIASSATTLEMVRSLVGAGIGCSLLHMRPATDITYAGHRVAEVPLSPAPPPLRIILGHLPDNPRRLVKAFVDQVRALFSEEESLRFLVRDPEAK